MQRRIGVRMSFETVIVRDSHTAQPDMIAGNEAVNVESKSRPTLHRARKNAFGNLKIRGRRDLDVCVFAPDAHDFDACKFRQGNVIAHVLVDEPVMRSMNPFEAEALRRLRAKNILAPHSRPLA